MPKRLRTACLAAAAAMAGWHAHARWTYWLAGQQVDGGPLPLSTTEATRQRRTVLRRAASRLVTTHDRAAIRTVAVETGSALGPDVDGFSVHVDILEEPSFARSPGSLPPVSGGWMAPDLVLTVPLTTDTAVHGMIVASANVPLPDEVTEGIEMLASLVTLALESVALNENLNRQRSEARVAALVENSSDVVMVLDSDLKIRYLTSSVTRVLGYDHGRLLGRALADIVHPDDLHLIAGLRTRAPEGRSNVSNRIEWRLRSGDGRWINVESVSNDLLERPDVGGIVVTTRDVTERKALEDSLKRQVEKLQELDQIKNDFVATVSHEFRTPLANILGQVEMLGDGDFGNLTVPQSRVLSVIERNSSRLLLLIEDLLTLNQMESGGVELDPVATDLRQFLDGMHREVAPSAAARGVGLYFDIASDVGIDVVDPKQLDRAVLNLLTNAIKFTPEGGRVVLRAFHSDNQIVIAVSDTGIGIPRDEQQHLFTRFFRSSVATRMAIQGTGLGLVIVKRIVEKHGGSISIQSALGEGTTVEMRIPVMPATVAA